MSDEHIIQLLTNTFENNHSVDLITGKNYRARKNLMRICLMQAGKQGRVHSTAQAAALSFFPDKKLPFVWDLYFSIQLVLHVIPITSISRILERNRYIAQQHPPSKRWHIYFIGVNLLEKGKGHGRHLLQQLEQEAFAEQRTVVLETSNPESLKFYQALGYTIYHEWKWEKVPFPLWFLKKEPPANR
ncbi:MAG: GNAT family N-acetyltransferase [Cytophagaceae bacterium]|jgi:GNAT superfamily N-acetyltransferase|nr:GNAT family N-acetyltransferase [Cytophagaceae bacterium]